LRAPGSHRAVAAYETAWVPNRPARIRGQRTEIRCRKGENCYLTSDLCHLSSVTSVLSL
jgi:hypothetical protein